LALRPETSPSTNVAQRSRAARFSGRSVDRLSAYS
jgi:hypothetical protein